MNDATEEAEFLRRYWKPSRDARARAWIARVVAPPTPENWLTRRRRAHAVSMAYWSTLRLVGGCGAAWGVGASAAHGSIRREFGRGCP